MSDDNPYDDADRAFVLFFLCVIAAALAVTAVLLIWRPWA
jgi:hypothetical protein